MKILVVDSTLGGSLIGGAQTFLVGLLDGLGRNSHDVHLISEGEPNHLLRDAITQTGVSIHTDLWDRSELVDDIAPRFASWINAEEPDVFVVSTSADVGWVVLPMLEPHIGTVCVGHANSDSYYLPARHYRDFINRAVGVSEEVRFYFGERALVKSEKTVWIPYGVTARNDSPAADDPKETTLRLVYVGRLAEPDKKASDLIRIVKMLERVGVDYSLCVIGDGPLMPDFLNELSTEIAENTVEMLGWIDNAALLEQLREQEVSLLVSESEGFCIALVEAMANGCAPIVTDIESGNKQLVKDGVNGFVVPVGDIEAFADKITILASDRARLLQMRQRAWETGREYGIGRMVANYERCFEEAVADARANPRTVDPQFPLMESCRSVYPLWLRRIKARLLGSR